MCYIYRKKIKKPEERGGGDGQVPWQRGRRARGCGATRDGRRSPRGPCSRRPQARRTTCPGPSATARTRRMPQRWAQRPPSTSRRCRCSSWRLPAAGIPRRPSAASPWRRRSGRNAAASALRMLKCTAAVCTAPKISPVAKQNQIYNLFDELMKHGGICSHACVPVRQQNYTPIHNVFLNLQTSWSKFIIL